MPHPGANEVRISTHDHPVKPCLVTLKCQSCDILQDLCHTSEGSVFFYRPSAFKMVLFIVSHDFLKWPVLTVNPLA